jgi:hypothetical protein
MQRGAAVAAEALTRIPPDMRDSWYEGIASNLADRHPAEVAPVPCMPECGVVAVNDDQSFESHITRYHQANGRPVR